MDKPGVIAAAALRERIIDAWREVPTPATVMSYPGHEEWEPVESYFTGRSIKEVDLFTSPVQETSCLGLMTEEAVHYYIRAYLLYLLAVERHAADVVPGCLGTPSIDALHSLCCESGVEHPLYSADQARCIRDVLKYVEQHLDFYFVRDEERLEKLWNAIGHWSDYAEDRMAGRRVRRQPPRCSGFPPW